MKEKMQCSRCEARACTVDADGAPVTAEAPAGCPMKTKAEVITAAMKKYTLA